VNNGRVWIVERQFRDGRWEASFATDIPSCHYDFYKAHDLKRAHMVHCQKFNSEWWIPKHFRVSEYARLKKIEAAKTSHNK
jgi:hypothetical protein